MLHKIRGATGNVDREPLSKALEVDESYIGGVAAGGKRGRSTERKTLVVGAVEVEVDVNRRAPGGRRARRVRLRVIEAAGAKELLALVRDHVSPGTTVYTDGWPGYTGRITAAASTSAGPGNGRHERGPQDVVACLVNRISRIL